MLGIQQLLALIIFLTTFFLLSCMGFWERTPSAANLLLLVRKGGKTEGEERRAPPRSYDHLRKVFGRVTDGIASAFWNVLFCFR